MSQHSGRYPIVAGGSSAHDVVPNGDLNGSIRASVASLNEQIVATRLELGKANPAYKLVHVLITLHLLARLCAVLPENVCCQASQSNGKGKRAFDGVGQ
jgi:hypothetical protein